MNDEFEVIKRLKNDPYVEKIEVIPDFLKKQILEAEMDRIKEVIPAINEGINDAFKEDHVAIIIKERDPTMRLDAMYGPELILESETGQIVGETIYDEEELEELKNRKDVYFLSDNFVTYGNIMGTDKKNFFKITSADIKFITNEKLDDCVKSITVAVPSTNADHHIRDYYQIPYDIGAMVIGFTEK